VSSRAETSKVPDYPELILHMSEHVRVVGMDVRLYVP